MRQKNNAQSDCRLDGVAADYTFKNTTGAKKVDLSKLKDTDELPDHLAKGAKQ
ncbi:hypothetical protein [Rhizobium sp. CF122]|uniref:hypothetical protein n=1 Tax=Rhizobium sp. CF122 TaxID=1144312 RepID=UPI0002F238F4|nr:hypothetical protein [Rhizobium sp. CF122]